LGLDLDDDVVVLRLCEHVDLERSQEGRELRSRGIDEYFIASVAVLLGNLPEAM